MAALTAGQRALHGQALSLRHSILLETVLPYSLRITPRRAPVRSSPAVRRWAATEHHNHDGAEQPPPPPPPHDEHGHEHAAAELENDEDAALLAVSPHEVTTKPGAPWLPGEPADINPFFRLTHAEAEAAELDDSAESPTLSSDTRADADAHADADADAEPVREAPHRKFATPFDDVVRRGAAPRPGVPTQAMREWLAEPAPLSMLPGGRHSGDPHADGSAEPPSFGRRLRTRAPWLVLLGALVGALAYPYGGELQDTLDELQAALDGLLPGAEHEALLAQLAQLQSADEPLCETRAEYQTRIAAARHTLARLKELQLAPAPAAAPLPSNDECARWVASVRALSQAHALRARVLVDGGTERVLRRGALVALGRLLLVVPRRDGDAAWRAQACDAMAHVLAQLPRVSPPVEAAPLLVGLGVQAPYDESARAALAAQLPPPLNERSPAAIEAHLLAAGASRGSLALGDERVLAAALCERVLFAAAADANSGTAAPAWTLLAELAACGLVPPSLPRAQLAVAEVCSDAATPTAATAAARTLSSLLRADGSLAAALVAASSRDAVNVVEALSGVPASSAVDELRHVLAQRCIGDDGAGSPHAAHLQQHWPTLLAWASAEAPQRTTLVPPFAARHMFFSLLPYSFVCGSMLAVRRTPFLKGDSIGRFVASQPGVPVLTAALAASTLGGLGLVSLVRAQSQLSSVEDSKFLRQFWPLSVIASFGFVLFAPAVAWVPALVLTTGAVAAQRFYSPGHLLSQNQPARNMRWAMARIKQAWAGETA